MEVLVLFLAVVLAHFALTAVQFRFGVLFLILTYGLYPKLFSVGISEQGFALSGQRAMLYVLVGFYVMRALWGSAEIRHGIDVLSRHRALVAGLVIYLAARVVGNLLAARIDIGSIAGLVNEFIVSLFIVMLIATYVRTRDDVLVVLSLVAASFFLNQLVALMEFSTGEAISSGIVDIQYQTEEESKLTEGSVRAGYFRSRGFFDNPLKLAGFLCMTLPVLVALIRTSRIFLVRLMAATAIAMTPFTAVFTGSRTAVAVLALIILWYAYANFAKRLSRLSRGFMNGLAAAAAVGVLVLVASGAAESLFFGAEYARSTESRVFQFVRVPMALAASPLFGFGFARNIIDMLDIGHVDSFFLHTALEGGLVALLASIYVMYRAIRLLLHVARAPSEPVIGIIAGNVAVSIGSAFVLGLVLSLSDIRFYLFLSIGIAIVLDHLNEAGTKSAR